MEKVVFMLFVLMASTGLAQDEKVILSCQRFDGSASITVILHFEDQEIVAVGTNLHSTVARLDDSHIAYFEDNGKVWAFFGVEDGHTIKPAPPPLGGTLGIAMAHVELHLDIRRFEREVWVDAYGEDWSFIKKGLYNNCMNTQPLW